MPGTKALKQQIGETRYFWAFSEFVVLATAPEVVYS